MTTLRLLILLITGLVLVIVTLTSLLALLVLSRADLLVVCLNTADACDTLAEHYEQHARTSIDIVRVPTSETLSHLAATHGDSEFNTWLDGPVETHTEAEHLGLPRSVEGIDVSGLPEHYHSAPWFDSYGRSSRSTQPPR